MFRLMGIVDMILLIMYRMLSMLAAGHTHVGTLLTLLRLPGKTSLPGARSVLLRKVYVLYKSFMPLRKMPK